jgi:hypothetical protein
MRCRFSLTRLPPFSPLPPVLDSYCGRQAALSGIVGCAGVAASGCGGRTARRKSCVLRKLLIPQEIAGESRFWPYTRGCIRRTIQKETGTRRGGSHHAEHHL